MMTNLAFLRIYPDAIDSAIDTVEEAMKDLGFTVSELDDMNEAALDDVLTYLQGQGYRFALLNELDE